MRGYKTIHTLTKRIKNRTTDNDNNNNNNNNKNNNIIIIIIVIVLAVITIISSYVNERYSTTLDIEIEKKK